MSITRLRVGQEAYTLAGVAQRLGDYYTGVGEACGAWLGTSAGRLGLVGEVGADDLRAVMAGIAPGSGGLSPNGETIRPHPRRVPGFDLTWKVPKSVSVLYAVSDDPRVQAAMSRGNKAGDTAVREALGWIEREAIRVRRETGIDKPRQLQTAVGPVAERAGRPMGRCHRDGRDPDLDLLLRFHLETGARGIGAIGLCVRDLDPRRQTIWLREVRRRARTTGQPCHDGTSAVRCGGRTGVVAVVGSSRSAAKVLAASARIPWDEAFAGVQFSTAVTRQSAAAVPAS